MGFFDSKTKTSSESSATPWGYAAPGLVNASARIGKWGGTPMEFFPDQTYASQTGSEAQAIEQLKAGAAAYPGMMGGMFDPAAQAWQGAMGAPQAALGMGLQDVMNNPALQGAAEAIQSQVNRNLQENILPSLTTRAMQTGGVGGSRQSIAEGLAGRGTSEVLAEQLANMYGQAWGQGLGAETARYTAGLGAQQGAFSQLPGMMNLALSQYTQPAALLGQAGGLERQEEQRAIDEAMARHEFAQMEPYNRGTMVLGSLMGPGTAFGTSKQEGETTSKPSTFSNIGQLVGLGGAAGGALFGGPAGAMAGGALSSGYSDLYGGLLPPSMSGGGFLNPYQAAPVNPSGFGANPWYYR